MASGMKSGGPRLYLRARKIILLVAFNALLIVGGAELILRSGEKFSPALRRLLYFESKFPADDYKNARNLEELLETVPWHMTPFARHLDYILNSKGLRTHEYERKREKGVRRVVMIGDSFLIHGGDLPEERHVVTATSELLNGRSPTELINLGVPAVGLGFYLRMLEVEGILLSPDLVMVCIFVGNDFIDEINRWGLIVHWRGYRFCRNLYRYLVYGGGVQGWPGDPEAHLRTRGGYSLEYQGPRDLPPPMTLEGYRYLQLNRSVVFHDPWPPIIARHWDEMQRDILKMRDICTAARASFLLALIPDETQVTGKLQDYISSVMRRQRHDFKKPQKVIAEFCGNNGIDVVDLLPPFQAAADRGEELYCQFDTHWNENGQRIAAKAFAGAIERELGRRQAAMAARSLR